VEIIKIKQYSEEVKLAPVGDIQYGADTCNVEKLQRHIRYGIDNGWTFLGMGDYLDHFSPSNRRTLLAAKSTLYDSAREIIDTAVRERVYELEQILAGDGEDTLAYWGAMVGGDHTWQFEDGTTSDEELASQLGAPFAKGAVMLEIEVAGCPLPLRVFATHGAGSSISMTGKTLHLERLMRSFEADIYLMGHSHLKYGVPVDRYESVVKGKKKWLVNRTKILGITGSFMEGYVLGQTAYPEEKALAPIPTGGLLITGRPVKEEWGWRWDLFVSA
jgi:hypothetical protein